MAWLRRKNDMLPGNEDVSPMESPPDAEHGLPLGSGEIDNTFSEPQAPLDEAVDEEEDASAEEQQWLVALKRELHQDVIAKLNISTLTSISEDDLRIEIRRLAESLLKKRSALLSLEERERLVNEVLDETFGLGPLESLMADHAISDILINGPKTIYVERRGQLQKTPVTFHDNRHVVQMVQRIASQVGRRVDETCPMVDARLPDGSRLNAIIPPLALDGPLVSIRRFGAKPLLIEDLIGFGAITPEILSFLKSVVEGRMNVLISGGTGSGKTTLLNALSRYIPAEERVATIEDAAELQLQQPHVVRMETRPANIEGEGEVGTRDLVRNALRMRPDRIIVGECRGSEALDMLQAMNTGHEGSLTTIHANSPRDALSRLEMMVGMAGFDLPIWVIRKQVASAINVVVQVARLMGGVRKVIRVSEITGMEGDVLSMQDIFEFKQVGLDEHRVAQGHFMATGIRPTCLPKLEACGCGIPVELFERRILPTVSQGKT